MTDYTKTTDFAAKDALPSGDANKVVKGAEFEVEFDNIVTAIASKFDSTSTVDINAGNIDGTVIGAASPSAGTFTNLTATGTVTLASPILNTAVSGTAVLDEDDMASDSATKLATQQSIKAYVDASTAAVGIDGITSTATATQITITDDDVSIVDELIVGDNVVISSRGGLTLNNIGIGRLALDATAGSLNKAGNIAIGTSSQTNNTDGMKNVSVGDSALTDLTNGNSNTAVGYNAGYELTTGDNNTAVGEDAYKSGLSGSYNTAIGSKALMDVTTQSYNTAVGYEALHTGALTANATAVGYQALYNNNTASANIGIGYKAGYSLEDGAFNIIIGREALSSTTRGNWNVAIGQYALQDATSTSTDRNIAIGYAANGNQTTPKYNVSIGDLALNSATGSLAWHNTSVGRLSHYDVTTGANNTAIGAFSGDTLTTGSNNTSLGYQSAPSAAGSSNQVTLGNSSISSLRCQVTSISGLSDARDKTAVEPLSGASDFIRALNPVSFEWNQRDGNRIGEKDHGFIAQDLQEVQSVTGYEVPRLVLDENPEKLEAAYGTLLPTIVAALQEALTEIESLKAQLGNS